MEDGKSLKEKITESIKIRKDQCLIIILAGILLCVIALPVRKEDSESGISDIRNVTIDNHISASADEVQGDISGMEVSYASYWEDSLEEALRYVEGVGKVKVLITLKESEQKIVEKDGTDEHTQTQETDSTGGNRTVTEDRVQKSTIYTIDDRGQNVPYVVRMIPPTVEGVVVIAQGAGRQEVQENIIEAIQVLFDIDVNKIKIVKMKNNQ